MLLLEQTKSLLNRGLKKTKQPLFQKPGRIRKFILGFFLGVFVLAGIFISYNSNRNIDIAKASGLDCVVENLATVTYSQSENSVNTINTNNLNNEVDQCSSASIKVNVKTQDLKVFKPGTQYYYTVGFENTGLVDLKEVTITDTANSNIDFAGNTCETVLSDINGSSTLPFATSGCLVDKTSNSIRLTLANNLEPGQKYEFKILANLKDGAQPGVYFENGVVVTGKIVTTDQSLSDSSQDTVSTPAVNLSMTTNPSETIRKNVEFYYNVIITNPSKISLANLKIADQLPGEVEFIDTTCVNVLVSATKEAFDLPLKSCTINGSNLEMELLNPILANQQIVFGIKAKIKNDAPDTGVFRNDVQLTSSVIGENGALGESVTNQASSNVSPTKIWVEKSVSDLNVIAGDENKPGTVFNYTIRYGNENIQSLDNLSISDEIPTNYTFVNDGSCGGCTYDSTANRLTWSNLSLPGGDNKTLTFKVQVKNKAVAENNICNVVILSDGVNNYTSRACNNIISYNLNVAVTTPEPEYILNKNNSESTEFDYTIKYKNLTNQPLTNVLITDTLDNRLVYVTCSNNCNYEQNNKKLTWTIPQLAPLAEGQVTVKVKLNNNHVFNYLETIPNTVTIDSDQTDLKQNSVDVVVKYFDVSIVNTPSKNTVNPGETYGYTVTYKNETTNPLTNVEVKYVIDDPRITYVEGSCTLNCTYNPTAKTLTWKKDNLGLLESQTVEFKVTVQQDITSFDNIVTASTITSAQTPGKSASSSVGLESIIGRISSLIRTGGSGVWYLLITVSSIGAILFFTLKKKKTQIDTIIDKI